MNKAAIIEDIRWIMDDKMNLPHMDQFSPEARLNQDLYLDSVQFLQLLLNLELEKGYDIPEDALSSEAFVSVNSLAEFLLTLQEATA
jgi:acyl carrier protein